MNRLYALLALATCGATVDAAIEQFALAGDLLTITNNNHTVSHVHENDVFAWNTAYGTTLIHGDYVGTYAWEVHVDVLQDNPDNFWEAIIGVATGTACIQEYASCESTSWGWIQEHNEMTSGSSSVPFDEPFDQAYGPGDTIKAYMVFTGSSTDLYFAVKRSGSDTYSELHHGLNVGATTSAQTFRLFVSVGDSRDQFTIISSSITADTSPPIDTNAPLVPEDPGTVKLFQNGTDVYKCAGKDFCFKNIAGSRDAWVPIPDPGLSHVLTAVIAGEGTFTLNDDSITFQSEDLASELSWPHACQCN